MSRASRSIVAMLRLAREGQAGRVRLDAGNLLHITDDVKATFGSPMIGMLRTDEETQCADDNE